VDVLADLRDKLHRAVDDVLSMWEAGAHAGTPADLDVRVSTGDSQGPWTYTWPDGTDEEFARGRWYRIDSPQGSADVLVAWCERRAWGRVRSRAIVFHRIRSDSSVFYPWTEFVETDDERFASAIPDPNNTRALLADGDALPARFSGTAVERADHVFSSIRQGPSLRLMVSGDDEEAMVRHGYWVATLRGRL
jgi:hypothetical protein